MTNDKKTPWNKGKDSRIDLVCLQCGSIFKRYPSQIREVNFCSHQCKANSVTGVKRSKIVCEKISKSHKKRGKTDEEISRFKKHRWTRGNCNPHSEETKQKISLANRKNKVEEFNGYIKSQDKLERLRFQREVQQSVLERDNYTCQMCGKRGCALQVDHIQSWAEYVELRFDINNCRTLCMDCHYKITFDREKPEGVTTWGHNLSQIGGIGS